MNPYTLINIYYKEQNELKEILLNHSEDVAQKCISIAQSHPELELDQRFLKEAAMLHDIGIIFTHAPDILCYGTHHYICHGHLGAELLRKEGFPKHARVCERHTGTGLTRTAVEAARLPLPSECYLPETKEEKVICFADKFFSKTHLGKEKSFDETLKSMEKLGKESVETFKQWAIAFL